jgi:hypothetical protein
MVFPLRKVNDAIREVFKILLPRCCISRRLERTQQPLKSQYCDPVLGFFNSDG